MSRPNFLRVANHIVNLDRVTNARFVAKDGANYQDDALYFEFGAPDAGIHGFRGAEARAAWRALNSLRPLGDCDPPTPEEALAECYLVRLPDTPLDGPHLWSAATLADLVARVDSGWSPGPNQEYRIDLDGEIWGFLVRHDERRWMIRQKNGAVTVAPGATIL